MSDWTWIYNPKRLSKCPICGGKAKHFGVPDQVPHLGWCWEPPSTAPQGWKPTKNPHIFIDTGKVPDDWETAEVIDEKPERKLAPPNLRDAIYRELLKKLSLSGAHRKDIINRGFTPEQIENIPFATLQSGARYGYVGEIKRNFPKGSLDGVPGFFINQSDKDPSNQWWTLAGRTGLLIPITDINGRIIAFQNRPDYSEEDLEKDEQPKYVWLSSGKKEKGGSSPSSPAGVLFPPGTDKKTNFKTVVYTEGFFKALATMLHFHVPVVWVAGVHQWKNAVLPLSQFNTEEILIAFDSDSRTNPHVQAALLQSVSALGNMIDDVVIKAVQWDPDLGKGIDDAILDGGLTFSQLEILDTDKILTSISPPRQVPNSKFLRINEDVALEPPEEKTLPSREECWEATDIAMQEAFETQPGTISLITAGTGFGKTTALTQHIQPKTLIVSRDYDDAGEQLRKLLISKGINPQWIFGRQLKKVEPGAPESKKQRAKEAFCEDFYRAIAATKSNHNPCLGCPFGPRQMEDGTLWYSCGYRQHRDELQEDFPEYGLAVPKVALQPGILKRFDSIVFDDLPDLLQYIADERVLHLGDIAIWQSNHFDEMPWEVRQFIAALRKELAKCNKEPLEPSQALRELAKQALKSIKRKKSPLPCEQSFVGDAGKTEYPKAWIRDTLTSFANGMPVDLTAEKVTFWTGRPEILDIFKTKRIIILDATVDLTVYKSLFGKSLFYLLNIPELPQNQPRIVQIPDILGRKEQIKRLAPQILKLQERENSFIMTRAGECTDELDADGYLGRHERALNSLQHYDSGILAGHYSLPPDASRKMAQGIRAVARQLNVDDPEVPVMERDEEGRAWHTFYDSSKRYAGLQRLSAVNEDALAAHITRHHHTSSVIQTWGRNRGPKILFLIDGKPLYSPDPDNPIWVTVMTLRELGIEPIETRGNNPKFKEVNTRRIAKRLARVADGINSLKDWVSIHEEVPSLRSLRKKLGVGDKLCRVEVARDVKEGLQTYLDDLIVKKKQGSTGVLQGVPDYTDHNTTVQSGTPPTHSDSVLINKDNDENVVVLAPKSCELQNQDAKSSPKNVTKNGPEGQRGEQPTNDEAIVSPSRSSEATKKNDRAVITSRSPDITGQCRVIDSHRGMLLEELGSSWGVGEGDLLSEENPSVWSSLSNFKRGFRITREVRPQDDLVLSNARQHRHPTRRTRKDVKGEVVWFVYDDDPPDSS